jgi:hypothetical protein
MSRLLWSVHLPDYQHIFPITLQPIIHLLFQGQENERYFAMQAELEKQFSVLAAQLEGPVSEFEDSDREAQV